MRTTAVILSVLASVIGASVLLAVLVMLFLSDPDRATPFIRNQIENASGHPTALEAGWVNFAWAPTLRLRGLEIEERGQAQVFDTRIGIFSLLFGGRLVQHVQIEDADYTLEIATGEGEGLPDLLDRVRAVDGETIRLVVRRPQRDPAEVLITTASGDLLTGDFTLTATGGRSWLTMTGQAAGLSLENFRGELDLEGENFAEFAALLSLTAPDTPPFNLSGELSRDGEAWRFAPFSGVVGDSDLAGSMTGDFSGERPRLIADLTSNELDLDDLGVAIGAPSSVSEGEENDEQQAANQAWANDARLIPDAHLDLTRMRVADAEVTFSADTVYAGRLPLSSMEFDLLLENGVLTFSPLAFDATRGGRLTVFATIDASTDAVTSDVEGRLDAFSMTNIANGRLARGDVVSRFELSLPGSDLRGAFAGSNGVITLWAASNAQIRHLAVEGAALDLGEVFLLIMQEEDGEAPFLPVRCAGARFSVEEGIAYADPIVLDTDDSLIRMTGDISLRIETIDLTIEADAKDVSWGNLLGGVAIAGTLRDPEVVVDALPALLQGGAAVLLASVAGPLAAVPFTDLGFGEDAPCGQLMESARSAARRVSTD